MISEEYNSPRVKKESAMASTPISEQQILEALQRVPSSRWKEVLDFINALQTSGQGPSLPPEPIRTARELAQSNVIGVWADRGDLGDSRDFARRLRERAEHRGEAVDAAGY
jgi:hypothetical protein